MSAQEAVEMHRHGSQMAINNIQSLSVSLCVTPSADDIGWGHAWFHQSAEEQIPLEEVLCQTSTAGLPSSADSSRGRQHGNVSNTWVSKLNRTELRSDWLKYNKTFYIQVDWLKLNPPSSQSCITYLSAFVKSLQSQVKEMLSSVMMLVCEWTGWGFSNKRDINQYRKKYMSLNRGTIELLQYLPLTYFWQQKRWLNI